MATELGREQIFNWDIQSGSSYKRGGIVTGGPGNDTDNPWAEFGGIAGDFVKRALEVEPKGGVEMWATDQTKALLQYGLRASWPNGALTACKFQVGTLAKLVTHENAKISGINFEVANRQPLKCGVNWWALIDAASAAGTQAGTAPTDVMMWYDGSVTIGGTTLGCTRLSGSVENALEWDDDCDSRLATAKRQKKGILYGWETHTIEAEVKAPPSYDIDADAPAKNIALVVVASDNAGTPNTITFTYANLAYGGKKSSFVGKDGIVTYRINLIGHPGCLAIT